MSIDTSEYRANDELPYPAMVKGAFDYYSASQMRQYGNALWKQALYEADLIHKGLIATMAESFNMQFSQMEQDRKDVERYRLLRSMHWTDHKLTVTTPDAVHLGRQTYSMELLDAAIDAELAKAEK